MRTIIIFFLLSISFQEVISQEIIVRLQYPKNQDNIVWSNGIDAITIKQNHKNITTIFSDTAGIVRIPKSMLINNLNYDLSLTTIGIQENYLATLNNKLTDTLVIKLPKMYQIKEGYAICPKCKRSNKVCKISSEPILIMKVVKGDTIFSPVDKRTYYLGTDLWHEFNPLWYCKRDSIKF